jgi:hypothetical protein
MACFYGGSGYWRQLARLTRDLFERGRGFPLTEKKKGGMHGLSRRCHPSRIKLLESNFFNRTASAAYAPARAARTMGSGREVSAMLPKYMR